MNPTNDLGASRKPGWTQSGAMVDPFRILVYLLSSFSFLLGVLGALAVEPRIGEAPDSGNPQWLSIATVSNSREARTRDGRCCEEGLRRMQERAVVESERRAGALAVPSSRRFFSWHPWCFGGTTVYRHEETVR